MPECQNCNYKWSWKTAFKKAMKFNSGIECPNCGRKQYVTTKSRIRGSIIGSLSGPIIIFSSMIFDLDLLATIAFGLLLIVLVTLTTPYTIELSNDNKPLW